MVVKDGGGTAHTFKICVTHQFPIPDDEYILLRSRPLTTWDDRTSSKYWAVGRRMPERKFQKVLVFVMDDWKEVKRLDGLRGVAVQCRNVLV